MQKILYVNLENKMAGAEKSLWLLARYLRDQFQIVLACPGQGALKQRFEQLGIQTISLPKSPTRHYLSLTGIIYLFYLSLVLFKLIIAVRPDIVHANTFSALVCTALPTRLTGKALIVHARDFHRQRFLSILANFCCRQIIVISKSLKSHLINEKINPNKIVLIYNGIEPPCRTLLISSCCGKRLCHTGAGRYPRMPSVNATFGSMDPGPRPSPEQA